MELELKERSTMSREDAAARLRAIRRGERRAHGSTLRPVTLTVGGAASSPASSGACRSCWKVNPASRGGKRGRRRLQHVGPEVPEESRCHAQREIELSVREQLEAGELRGDETLEATATVVVSGLPRDVVVAGTIALT